VPAVCRASAIVGTLHSSSLRILSARSLHDEYIRNLLQRGKIILLSLLCSKFFSRLQVVGYVSLPIQSLNPGPNHLAANLRFISLRSFCTGYCTPSVSVMQPGFRFLLRHPSCEKRTFASSGSELSSFSGVRYLLQGRLSAGAVATLVLEPSGSSGDIRFGFRLSARGRTCSTASCSCPQGTK
jgi:hypothetical protein